MDAPTRLARKREQLAYWREQARDGSEGALDRVARLESEAAELKKQVRATKG